jgi:hypothetical protein
MKPIHFEDVNWGTFTALHRRYKREHPTTKFKSLEAFANHIIRFPNKFSAKAHKKALFYVNVILPHTANMTAVHHSRVGGYMPIMYGGSWTGALLDPMGTLKNSISAVGDVLLHGRNRLIPSAQKVLDQYGNGKIEGMTLMRTPISNALTEITNAITSGQLNQLKQQKSFDDLFHTSLFVRVAGVWIMIQKETTVKIDVRDLNQVKNAKNGQILPVPIRPNVTMNSLLENGEKYMGSNKFYNSYSARDNNCQDWLSAVLTASGLNNGRTEKFIKQSVEEAFSPFARKITNTITDIGHLAETAYQGGTRRKPRMIMCGGANGDDDENKFYVTFPDMLGFPEAVKYIQHCQGQSLSDTLQNNLCELLVLYYLDEILERANGYLKFPIRAQRLIEFSLKTNIERMRKVISYIGYDPSVPRVIWKPQISTVRQNIRTRLNNFSGDYSKIQNNPTAIFYTICVKCVDIAVSIDKMLLTAFLIYSKDTDEPQLRVVR